MYRFPWAGVCLASLALAQQYAFVPVKAPNAPSNVVGLFQDHLGRLWVQTRSDVACFDGSRFFYLRDFGFPEAEVLSIADDEEDGIWIGSRAGLHRYSKGRLSRIQEGVVPSVVLVAPGVVLASIGVLNDRSPDEADLVRIRRSGNTWISEKIPNARVIGTVSCNGSQYSPA